MSQGIKTGWQQRFNLTDMVSSLDRPAPVPTKISPHQELGCVLLCMLHIFRRLTMPSLPWFDRRPLNTSGGHAPGSVDRLVNKWYCHLGISVASGNSRSKKEGRKVSEGRGLRTESVFKDKLVNGIGVRKGKEGLGR